MAAAVAAGKTVTLLSRRLSIGGGTTFPGTVARRIDRQALTRMAARLPRGSVVVTGTNGKTTTTRMIANVLRTAGLRPVHNRSGSNLIGGVTSALLGVSSLTGQPGADIGLFEVDEATLPVVVPELRPAVAVFTNLFRDQLDRYGEVDFVASTWRQALRAMPAEATVLLNGDDPLVASLGAETPAQVRYFGIDDERHGHHGSEHTADTRSCTRCGARLEYEVGYYGHVGKFFCPSCGLRRPDLDVRAAEVVLQDTAGSHCRVVTPEGELDLRVPVPGLYNAYNALAAVGTGLALGLPLPVIQKGIESFSAAFGRIERIPVEGREIFMALVKNPVGFNEVLRTLFLEPTEKRLLILINDNIADGTDISWLWDVEFELLPGKVLEATVSGTRAEDMAVRLKYAQVDPARIRIEKDQRAALRHALESTPPGETLYLLPTYTAMLEIRALMHKLGYVGKFWED